MEQQQFATDDAGFPKSAAAMRTTATSRLPTCTLAKTCYLNHYSTAPGQPGACAFRSTRAMELIAERGLCRLQQAPADR